MNMRNTIAWMTAISGISLAIVTTAFFPGCTRRSTETQAEISKKPENMASSSVPREKLVDLAAQALRGRGLENKYNLNTGLYLATQSQTGEHMVVFCHLGYGTPVIGNRAVDCIVYVSSRSPSNNVIRIEELNWDAEKRLFVSVDEPGKASGYRWKQRDIPTTNSADQRALGEEVSSASSSSSDLAQCVTIFGANQWLLTVLRDGGGWITQGHLKRKDRSARIPSNTFSFAKLQKQLQTLPASPAGPYEIIFQFAKGIPERRFHTSESRLISELFDKSKEHARKGFPDLDRLWAEKPPVMAETNVVVSLEKKVELRILDKNETTSDHVSDAIRQHAAKTLTIKEIAGDWNVAIPGTNHVPVLGNVSWKSISFSTNLVSWTWERDGKSEKHKGTFEIIPEKPAKAGMHQSCRIEIIPTTLAVPGSLVLKNVTHDLDNRFRLGTLVLKFQDEKGNSHVFLKR